MAFKLNTFIDECQAALQNDKPQELIADLLRAAIADPDALAAELEQPERAGISKIFVSDALTIINVSWAPKMIVRPHNHNTWAVIAVYAGREDNIFWRRLDSSAAHQLEAAGAKSIACGEVVTLGKNLIHSVTNPADNFTRAIHIYGGNFFEIQRSEWDPEQLTEQPYNVERNLASFAAENAIVNFRQSS